MIVSKVGSSVLTDAFLAGKQATEFAKIDGAKVAMVYCSCAYDVTEVVKGVKEVLDIPVLGNTSFTGVITPDGYVGGDKPFVGVLTLAGEELKVGIAGQAKADCAIKQGKQLAQEANTNIAGRYIFSGFKTDTKVMFNADEEITYDLKENYNNFYETYQSLAKFIRSRLSSWKKEVLREFHYECCITGNAVDVVIHHCRGVSILLQETIDILGIEIKTKIKYVNS